MEHTLFTQVRHAMNFGAQPDMTGQTFSPEQLADLQFMLRGNPTYFNTLKADGYIWPETQKPVESVATEPAETITESEIKGEGIE